MFRCLGVLEGMTAKNEDQRKGIEIVKYALTRPLFQIATNAGLDASVIVNKVKECENPMKGLMMTSSPWLT